jgi:hypothetical protein
VTTDPTDHLGNFSDQEWGGSAIGGSPADRANSSAAAWRNAEPHP